MSKDIIVHGSSGGGGGGSSYTPIEEPNNLQANTTVRLIDVLCEGLIKGGANGEVTDSDGLRWKKSIYFNETPLVSSDNKPNYTVQSVEPRCGYVQESESPLKDFDSIDSVTVVNTELRNDTSPYIFTVTDTEVDSAYVSIEIPALMSQADNGDLVKTTVQIHIDVYGDDGAGDVYNYVTADGDGMIYGKNISKFRKQFYLPDLYRRCGVGPWQVKVYRDTEDSDSAKLQNKTYVYSYTESKEVKMEYPSTSVVGLILRSDKFGDQIPSRAYKIHGRLINVPDNYTPNADGKGGTYSGPWGGSFHMKFSSNPAWVLYDMLTNERFGLGEHIDRDLIDKWSLYTIGQYCDEDVTYTERTRLPGGGYDTEEKTEPRFTFNGPISTREQALAVINHLCSVFRGYPIWASGYVSFVQDSPKDITRIATQANVKDGLFEYSDTDIQLRTTAARVTYNNMDMFGRADIVSVEDQESIPIYGYNPVDIHCFGCTSKAEAVRRAKYIINTDLNQTEMVSFIGGLEWADTYPGEVIGIQDKDYVSASLSGRVVSGTTTSITIDREIEIEGGETYTLYVADNDSVAVHDKTITNGAGTTSTITWSVPISEAPTAGQVWGLTKASVNDIREFQVLGVKEIEAGFQYKIEAINYNADKYAEVEEGYESEVIQNTNLPVGKLTPPTDLQIQPYTYTDGDKHNRKYGALISWIASSDVRTIDYEVQAQLTSTAPEHIGVTSECAFDWKDVGVGTYTVRVRARGATGNSKWISFAGFTMVASTGNIGPVSNLHTVDDPVNDYFNGPDCEIDWDASGGAYYDSSATVIIADGTDTQILELDNSAVGADTIAGYKVEVYKLDDTLLRTYQTEDAKQLWYNYTFNMNKDDNSGTPIRDLKFKVYAIDRYDQVSAAATLVASNPIPSMSSVTPDLTEKYNYIKVEWDTVDDNDMDKYVIYADTTSPLSTVVGTVSAQTTSFEVFGFDYGDNIYIQIEPYDLFGAGTKSQIPGAVNILKIPAINVNAELQNSIVITTDTTGTGTLTTLYDDVIDSGGYTWSNPEDGYVQYEYGLQDYIDRVSIWSANANPRIYFAMSDDGTTWRWFAGDASHAKDVNGDLTSYASEALSKTNYWQLAANHNWARFPDRATAKYVRMYFANNNSTTIYEFVPARMLIAELAAIGNVSAISSNIGTMVAGTLQNEDYSPSSGGMLIDLDDAKMTIRDASGTIRVKLGDLS